jgi:spore germination cell wall hydrolase CwlJ-like protein
MNLAYPAIRATAFMSPIARVILVTISSALLLAAGSVSDTRPTVAAAIVDTATALPQPGLETATSSVAPLEQPVVAPRPASLSALMDRIDDADDAIAKDRDLHCLATAVYFESRGEPLEGQLAVAQAILNRVESGRYADTACGVIDQPGQFSFRRSRAPTAGEAWQTAKSIAVIAARDMWTAVAPAAMSFHASYVAPNWRGKARTVRIGRHIFYR